MTDRGRAWQSWAIPIGLFAIVFLLRLPSLEQPFDNDSGAVAYHARLISRGEPLYGTHHPTHHLPAGYYVYALAFLIFGDSLWAVKFALILWTALAAYLMYRLGALFADEGVGLLAAVFFAVLSSQVFLFGGTAELELFANPVRIVAVLAAMYLVSRDAAPYKYAVVGVLCAVAFMFKAVYLSPLAMAGCTILVEAWRTRGGGVWRKAISRGVWIGIGGVATVLSVVAYFWSLGLLPRLLLVFTIGQKYIGLRSANPLGYASVFLLPFAGIGMSNVALLVLALGGGVMAVRDLFARERSLVALYMSVWLAFSFLEAGFNRAFYTHYYQLLIPPLAWLAAWFVSGVYRAIRSNVPSSKRWGACVGLIVILTVTFGISVWGNRDYYVLYARYRLGLGTYEEFVLGGWPQVDTHEFTRTQALADYVRARTSPADRIYYWSGGVQVYYLADRRCAIDIIWPIYAEATGPYQRIFAEGTKYVIIGESYMIPRPGWLYTELAKNYVLETVIRDQEVYRRLD
jgi:4-amino-4-deoxy-L-arabinose transferase-like glycosyltransferase